MLHLERAPAPRSTPSHASAKLSGDGYGLLINLSGRRRFTSQRVVLYAVLASQGREGALAMSRDALKMFCDAHLALVEGNSQVPGVFCDELREVYFGSLAGDQVIRSFITLAQRTLDAIESGKSSALCLDPLVDSATPLLVVLNKITQVYEDLARRQAGVAKKQLAGVMTDIESIAKRARIVSVNAQIVAARAGGAGREFSVVAGELSQITGKIDELVRVALRNSVA